jgi:hypothetical protein
MKRLPLLLLPLLLMGGDCEPKPEPKGYCTGMETVSFQSAVRSVEGLWNTIIGGFPAEERHSTVYVGIIGTGSCSGTILSPHTVLTAGHCNGPNGYRVYLDPVKEPQKYWTATGSLLHPGYSRWAANRGEPHDDLLLLYFDDVTLPEPYTTGFYDDNAQSAQCTRTFGQGWGQTSRPDAPPPEGYEPIPCPEGVSRCLQEANLRVFSERDTDINSRLVSVWNFGAVCFGDSGSALYAMIEGYDKPLIAGVLSTVSSHNCVGGPTPPYTYQGYGTHVKVSAYSDWITQNMH